MLLFKRKIKCNREPNPQDNMNSAPDNYTIHNNVSRRTFTRSLSAVFASLCFGALAAWTVNTFFPQTDIMLTVDGKEIGAVLDIDSVQSIKHHANDYISNITGKETNVSQYFETHTLSQKRFAKKHLTLCNAAKSRLDGIIREAYVLYVDGKEVASTGDMIELVTMLEEKLTIEKNSLLEAGDDIDRVEYSNDIFIDKALRVKNELISTNSLRKYIGLDPLDQAKAPKIRQFDNEMFDKSENSQVLQLDYSYTAVPVGILPTLTLSSAGETKERELPDLSIAEVKVKEETVMTDYPIEYIEDPELREGAEAVVQRGKQGISDIVYEIKVVDNFEVAKTAVKETIIQEPRKEIVKIGTRPLTELEKQTAPTGTYVFPYEGILTSPFGNRGKEYHKGWDIAGPRGEPVVACDGGIVIAADNGHGYGNYVIIDHGSGLTTLYAHMDTICTTVGELVGQGWQIGTVGSTGQSTGNHVHVEFKLNDVPQNPAKYLPDTLQRLH